MDIYYTQKSNGKTQHLLFNKRYSAFFDQLLLLSGYINRNEINAVKREAFMQKARSFFTKKNSGARGQAPTGTGEA